MSNPSVLKPLDLIGSSREDLKEFPDEVKQDIGYALFEAQKGQKSEAYVLHCFQKKSKSGIKTPQQDIDLIARRLKAAEEDYKAHYQRGK